MPSLPGCLLRCQPNFRTMAVDYKPSKSKQCMPTVTLDLASDETVQYLTSLLKQPGHVFYVHAAPPDGTCSRPEKPHLKKARRKLGVKPREPLRTHEHPEGCPVSLAQTWEESHLQTGSLPTSPQFSNKLSVSMLLFQSRTQQSHGCGGPFGCKTSLQVAAFSQ